MDVKQYKKIKQYIDILLGKIKDKALEEGEDIVSDEFKENLLLVRNRILENLGIDPLEYEEMGRLLREQKLAKTKKEKEELNQKVEGLELAIAGEGDIILKIDEQLALLKDKKINWNELINKPTIISPKDLEGVEKKIPKQFDPSNIYQQVIKIIDSLSVLGDRTEEQGKQIKNLAERKIETHPEKHTIESHPDLLATTKDLNRLVGGKEVDDLHKHKATLHETMFGGGGGVGEKGDKGDKGDSGITIISTATDTAITGIFKGASGKVALAIADTDYVKNEADPVAMAYLDQSVKTTGTPLFGGTTSGIPYSEINDEATTNLVTNPSFEVDTAGWAGLIGTETLSSSSTYSYFGTKSLKVITPGSVVNEGVGFTFNCLPNTTYTVSWWTRGGGYPLAWQLVGNSSGATDFGNAGEQGAFNFWGRCHGTKTTNGSDTTLTFKAYVGLWGSPAAVTFYVDGVQIEAKAYPTSYCDGSMGTGYAWTETAHASTSTRTAGWQYLNPSSKLVMDTTGLWNIPTGIQIGYRVLNLGNARLTSNALNFQYGIGGSSWSGGISFSGTTLYVGAGGNSTYFGTTSSNYDTDIWTGQGKITLHAESASGRIYVKANGDTDDYFSFTTISNIPTLLTVGACDLALGGTTEAVRIQDSTGNVGIGVTSPTAVLHLKAGTATQYTAPIKLTAGVLLTTPELGTLEYTDDGTTGHLYFTLNVATVITRVQII